MENMTWADEPSLSTDHLAFDIIVLIESIVSLIVVTAVCLYAWRESRHRHQLLRALQRVEESRSGRKHSQRVNEASAPSTSLTYSEWRHLLMVLLSSLTVIIAVGAQLSTLLTVEKWMIGTWCILVLSAILSSQLSSAVVQFDTYMSMQPVEYRKFVYRLIAILVVSIIIAIILSLVLAIMIALLAAAASGSSSSNNNDCNCNSSPNCCSCGGSTGAPYYYFWGGYYPYGYGYYPGYMWYSYPYLLGGRYRRYNSMPSNRTVVHPPQELHVQQNFAITQQPSLNAEQQKTMDELNELLLYQPPPFYRHLTSFAFLLAPIAYTTASYIWPGLQANYRMSLLPAALYGRTAFAEHPEYKLEQMVIVWCVVAMLISVAYTFCTLLTIRSVHEEKGRLRSSATDSVLPPPGYSPEYPATSRLVVMLCIHLLAWTSPNAVLIVVAIVQHELRVWVYWIVYAMLMGAFIDNISHSIFYVFVERKSERLIAISLQQFH